MLLVVDVGNTNITFGVYRDKELVTTFRLMSKTPRTSDEYGVLITELLSKNHLAVEQIEGVAIASVVPNVMHSLTGGIKRYVNENILNKDDLMLLESTKNKKRIIFINKCDLESKVSIDEEVVYGNTITNDGLDNLKSKIKELFNMEEIEKGDFNYLSNARHIATIHECISVVESIKEGLKNGLPIDMLEIDIKKIWELLGNLIGESYDEELLDELFSRFCVGK